jgi:predicted TIM-barrel fold metal-dependent hydrolase
MNHLTRRNALGVMAGLTCLPITGISAQPTATTLPRRIDVHFHYLPPEYRRAAEAAGHSHPDGTPSFPQWDAESAVAMMDRLNIVTGILSVSSPGIHFGDENAARKLARYVNEQGADAMQKYPGRFGLFASLPLPHIDGSLEEIAYAFDVLRADGVVLMTNQRGIYLGDERFNKVFEELNRRRSVVFIHPTSPSCAGCLDLALGYPRPMIEFLFDTTRAVTNMIFAGTLDKFPELKIIVPHAGATLPVLADRIQATSRLIKPITSEEMNAKLRTFYYDLAGAPIPRLLGALLQTADPNRLMYGSDWPFTPESRVGVLAKMLVETSLLDDGMREKIYQLNAKKLFPRLST